MRLVEAPLELVKKRVSQLHHWGVLTCLLITVCAFLISTMTMGQMREEEKPAEFESELALASKALDRDSKVAHLLRAVELRPLDRRNIVIEFEAGVLLTQRIDREHAQGVRINDGLSVFEGIVKRYDHRDYHVESTVLLPEVSPWLVPRSAVLAASIRRVLKDDAGAKALLRKAMDDIKWTYEKRKEEWLNAPAPPDPAEQNPFSSERTREKERSVTAYWEEQKQRAKTGAIFNEREMAVVGAAVRQYGLCFGRQKPHEVTFAMNEIIRDYPDTPMAKVARQHIDKARKLMDEDLFQSLSDVVMESLPPETAVTEERKVSPTENLAVRSDQATADQAMRDVGHLNVGKSWRGWQIGIGVIATALLAFTYLAYRWRAAHAPRS